MEIRKLTESDYDKFLALYQELAELHVQARPDCFVHREKHENYPKDAFFHNYDHSFPLRFKAPKGMKHRCH